MKTFLLILPSLLGSAGIGRLLNAQSCAIRDYDNGGTVWVCNTTISRPQLVPKGRFVAYASDIAGVRLQPSVGSFRGGFTDSSTININVLRPRLEDSFLTSLSSDQETEYNIGGSDFLYDDGPEDQQLVNLKLAPEDLNLKIPLVRRDLQLTNGQLELVGTAWAASKWIETNAQYAGYGLLRRTQCQTWATFLDAYQQQNISFWELTTGNQPSNAFSPFDTVEVVRWPSRLIFLPSYPDQALPDTQMRYPEKFLLATEASIIPTGRENPVLLGSSNRGEKYSWDIIQDLLDYVTGWIDSNLALNMQGGPHYVNFDGSVNLDKQHLFYRPSGSVRVRSFGNNATTALQRFFWTRAMIGSQLMEKNIL